MSFNALYCWMNEIESECEFEEWVEAVQESNMSITEQEELIDMGHEINDMWL